MILSLACIVEGHGDVKAVPVLLRRVAADVDPALQLRISPPLRVPRYKLVKTGEIERSVDLAARKTRGQGGVLVLIDGEDECPAQLGPQLLQRARSARSDVSLAVVLAKYEYEAWSLASAESLRGKRGLADDLSPPADPEAIRDAKAWLSDRMTSGRKYRETLDQPALTADLDFAKGRSADSFDKCFREIVQLLNDLRQRAQGN